MYASRWCFTINNPGMKDAPFLDEDDPHWRDVFGDLLDKDYASDAFWDNPADVWFDNIETGVQYIIVQLEKGENGTIHWQGFMILKERKYLNYMKEHFSKRAHWEVARGSNEQASAYCKKDDTHIEILDPFGKDLARYEDGEMPQRERLKRQEAQWKAEDDLEAVKAGYKRPSEFEPSTLMAHGFLPAYNALTADVLGPYRPDLKIITMVGPPGTGKSYSIQKCFPEHGRCIYGNSGCWFQNPTADVMIFEEFNGQIPLQRMLQMLDPYPLALEVKGRMAPALYKTVIITSNTSPASWYPIKPADEAEQGDLFKRKIDSIHALWDRLGYSNGAYVPVRKCGTYLEAPGVSDCIGMSSADYIKGCRDMFYRELLRACDLVENISDTEDPEGPYITDGDHDN